LKIAIFEFVCGSGRLRAPSSEAQTMSIDDNQWSALLNEGLAMLTTLANDMMRCGVSVHTILEPSIAQKAISNKWDGMRGNWSAIAYSPTRTVDGIAEHWTEASQGADLVIVIAPELDGTLERIVSFMRDKGVTVLAGDSCFMQAACDQWQTCSAWKTAGVRHPETWLLSEILNQGHVPDQPTNGRELTRHRGAWVVKRRDSAGCVGQRRYRNSGLLVEDIRKSSEFETGREKWIVQPWMEGTPASLAVMCHPGIGRDAGVVLGCFEQRVEMITENDELDSGYCGFGYAGGAGPVEGIAQEQLQEFADRVLRALPGQPQGWIGIDFMIEPDGHWSAMEVNPRLTSSYIGYRKWYGPELAKLWFRGILPRGLAKEFPRVSFSLENWER
jgi:predicted ATP-grasp superfamily ATP-dependent carboligase